MYERKRIVCRVACAGETNGAWGSRAQTVEILVTTVEILVTVL